MRKLDDASWDQDQTNRRFCRYVLNEDSDGLKATVRAMDRLGCWHSAVDQLKSGSSPNVAKGRALLSFWNDYGLVSIPSGLKEDLPHLIDAFRYLLPPYAGRGLRLYRGELESRHATGVYGISWTPIFEKAKQLADRRRHIEGPGVVLGIQATPDLIVVAVRDHSEHTLTLGEDEYTVDPRRLHGSVSVVSR